MLKVEDLFLRISNNDILRGVSIEAGRDEVVAIVGRNGAGKSSTFKSIIGIYKPLKGRILIEDHDITRLPSYKRVMNGLGYVPEDMRIFPWLTTKENIYLAAYLSKNLNKLDDIMDMILTIFPEIKQFLDREGFYLSGGEKKMLAIARSLATLPKYLLLDEALEGLAPIVVERFKNAIDMIKKQGIGVIIAESNVMIATRIAEKLYVLERGEIIFKGGPNELLADQEVMRILRGA
ncbi:MAG: ABC transporter ATP-binding protein [Candidatus Caldarchaeales archaeon]